MSTVPIPSSRLAFPSRRRFLRLTGAALAGGIAAPAFVGCTRSAGTRWHSGDPFSLGVASGSPAPDGFVLWTRLAADPLSTDPDAPGGVFGGDRPLGYEIASDPAMRTIVRSGQAVAEARFAHSVHLEVRGLSSGRPYWYRFTSGDAASRVGRAITTPAPGARLHRLRFAFASGANYEIGYFAVYRHLADEAPDFVVFLGDYIYEHLERRRPTVRLHSDATDAESLPQYRRRYAQYRLDPDLQRLHAEVPALATWDDHEVQNDYAADVSPVFEDRFHFLRRRTAAYRAFYEHMPLRPSLSRPDGTVMRIHDRFGFGELLQISLLDGRQYRSAGACRRFPWLGGAHQETVARCPELLPGRTQLGAQQESWLAEGLEASPARWNVIAQGSPMAPLRQRLAAGGTAFWTDDWNGYPAARARLLQHLHRARIANPVVISGDIHSFWANELKLDADDPRSPTVAAEFVGTSVTSYGPPHDTFVRYVVDNPHVRYFESRRRGYVSVEVNRSAMTAHFRAISDVRDAKASVETLRSFTVEEGLPGLA